MLEEPSSFEGDAYFDPRIPRKLHADFRLTRRGAWDMRPFGLRVIGKRLLACTSDDDSVLTERGECGVIGTRFQVDGSSLYNPITGTRTLPVRRWDEIRMRWTAENSPFITVREWKLPRAADGKIDLSKMSAVPRAMTEESPGRLPDPIEGSSGPVLHLVAAAQLARGAGAARSCRRHRGVRGRASWEAAAWLGQCSEFLCPTDAHDAVSSGPTST